jgi:hypothetical protein
MARGCCREKVPTENGEKNMTQPKHKRREPVHSCVLHGAIFRECIGSRFFVL